MAIGQTPKALNYYSPCSSKKTSHHLCKMFQFWESQSKNYDWVAQSYSWYLACSWEIIPGSHNTIIFHENEYMLPPAKKSSLPTLVAQGTLTPDSCITRTIPGSKTSFWKSTSVDREIGLSEIICWCCFMQGRWGIAFLFQGAAKSRGWKEESCLLPFY